MEKFSIDPVNEPIIGIAGVNNELEERIIRNRKEDFLNQDFKELEGKEVEKTFEHIKMIDWANAATNELRRKFGLPDFNIPAQNIHLIKEEFWKHEVRAFFESKYRAIMINESVGVIKIELLGRILHEMLHFKSYNSLQFTCGNDQKLTRHQVGLDTLSHGAKKYIFKNFNEAIIEKLTAKLESNALGQADFLRKDKDRLDALRTNNADSVNINSGELLFNENTYWAEEDGNGFIRAREWKKSIKEEMFDILVDKIYQRNKNRFDDKNMVIDEFTRVMFYGGFKEIIKLIDDTFWPGTVQALEKFENSEKDGKPFNDVVGQLQFVKDL